MKRSSQFVAALIISAGILASCTNGSDPGPGPATNPATTPTVGAPGSASITSPPGLGTSIVKLASAGPTTGEYSTTVAAKPGKLTVLLYCLNGKISIDVEGYASLPFKCTNQVIPFGSQIDITSSQNIKISIRPATGDMMWAMSVGQEAA